MKNVFLAISSADPNRDFSKGTREQPFWDEHAKFIDQLVDEGFILMGGPLEDEGGCVSRELLQLFPFLLYSAPWRIFSSTDR